MRITFDTFKATLEGIGEVACEEWVAACGQLKWAPCMPRVLLDDFLQELARELWEEKLKLYRSAERSAGDSIGAHTIANLVGKPDLLKEMFERVVSRVSQRCRRFPQAS